VVAVYHTPHFRIVDSAGVSTAVMDSLLAVVEVDYELVRAFLPEFPPPDTVLLVIPTGPGLPFIVRGTRRIGQYLNNQTLSLDYIPHQLAHVWTGYQRRVFLEEGLAVYVTTQLVPPDEHPEPYRTQSPHAWTSLFAANGSEIPMATAFGADNVGFDLAGSSADASAWELFLQAGSFTQWVVETYGRAAWLRLYKADNIATGLGADAAALETQWLQATRNLYPNPTPCEQALAPLGVREEFWCRRANGK
jgi:hypothetical protein